tara:strand:+ start:1685 stop:2488 length:804 start_codon:yes stop_codon:yes gene_type:complete
MKKQPSMTLGFVSLIGAGPGDPELLTIKAANRLVDADIVLYDGLVSAEVVKIAHSAQRFCVSKRARRPAVNQETIQRLMIRSAQRGKRVARLKSGDPFVLGRGGEEALALKTSGIPFEVIPGISAAISAPGLAGIPVTHRGLSSAFTVVSGHTPEVFGPVLESLESSSMTVVVLMGLHYRNQIAQTLLTNGWSPMTPCSIITAASTPQMSHWTGSLVDLATLDESLNKYADTPGTIIIGEVVKISDVIGNDVMPTHTIDAIAREQEG